MNNYYVYVCYVNGVVRYVGKGQGNRYMHCTSGKSSCAELNKAFFSDEKMEVVKVRENMDAFESDWLERTIIENEGFENLFNKTKGNNSEKYLFWNDRAKIFLTEFYDKVLDTVYSHDKIRVPLFSKLFNQFESSVGYPIKGFYPKNQNLLELLKLKRYKSSNNKFYIKIEKKISKTEFLNICKNHLIA